VDDIIPPCLTGQGCLIPPPGANGMRALELRSLIIRLRKLIDPGTVCRYFKAGLEDLELLAVIEDELKEDDDGEGHQAVGQGER